jgi:hypothetical protein
MFAFRALGQKTTAGEQRSARGRAENPYAAYLAVLARHMDTLFAAYLY